MHIDEALKKHLPKNYADFFNKAVEDRTVFLNGVNYQHNGKVWNVRLAMDGNKKLFIRLHTDNTIYGEYWEKREHGVFSKAVTQGLNPENSESSITTDESLFPFKHLDKLEFSDFQFNIIQKEQQVDTKAPNVTFRIDETVRQFFASCPQLIPESDAKPLDIPVTTTAPSEENYFFPLGMIFKAIMSLAALYLVYKVVGFTNRFWQEAKA